MRNDKPIRAGDLVIVVRGMACCGALTGAEGGVFKVIGTIESHGYCVACGAKGAERAHEGYPGRGAIHESRLKRIDPDAASDREREFDQLSRRRPHREPSLT